LRSTLAAGPPAGTHPRQIELAAAQVLGGAPGQMLLTYMEGLSIRAISPMGTPPDVLAYREGMRFAVFLIRHLMERGQTNVDAEPNPTAPRR
jgi:hypothetical protein